MLKKKGTKKKGQERFKLSIITDNIAFFQRNLPISSSDSIISIIRKLGTCLIDIATLYFYKDTYKVSIME